MRNSKLIVSAIVATIASVGVSAAFAADLPVKARPMPPAPIVVYNWTGCYIGGNVGGAWTKQDQLRIDQIGVGPSVVNYGSEEDSAFVGGGQVGCDYQFAGNWVVGVQGQFDWGDVNGTHILPPFPTFTMHDKTDFIGTATVRVGYLFAPQVLAYVKGGGAWTRNSDVLFGAGPPVFLSESTSWNADGWTVGGGLEWMFAPGWSVFGEFNHMDFGTRTLTFIAPPGLFPVGEHVNVTHRVETALFGVNYKFNWWSQPVVAKY